MKKITGLMAILAAAAALAAPAMARDWDDYNNCNTAPVYSYNTYTTVRHDVREVPVRNVRHEVRSDRGRFGR